MNILEVVAPEAKVNAAKRLAEIARMGVVSTNEWRLQRKDGSTVDVELTAQRLPDQRYLVIGRDITERRKAEEAMRRAAGVFEHSIEGIMITNPDNVIIDVNPAFSRITGYLPEEALGKSPNFLSSGRHTPQFYADMWEQLGERDTWRGEIWNRRKSGDVFAELLSIAVVRDTAGVIEQYVSVFSDISRIKSHEDELYRIAHFDALTGLPNRRLLSDRIEQALFSARRSGKLVAVCMLDLDGFKPVNDTYGHATGDRLLVTLADRLQEGLRAGDTLARLGGDEFVLLFCDLDVIDEVVPVLERVLQAITLPMSYDHSEICVSASIGVTFYPQDDADADTLLRHADQAMYRAKQLGKGRFHFFDAQQDRAIADRRDFLRQMELALENREFIFHYQPKVDLVSGQVLGFEALIRWQHPERGLLLPGEFIPQMAGSDVEIPLSQWVIESVVKQGVAWKQAGLKGGFHVSANLPSAHFQAPGFADWLRDLLAAHPLLQRGDLELEIIESASIADMDVAIQTLTEVRDLGVPLALDDFGTGYASLSYFRRLPVSTLKIDQGFVRDMLEDTEALGIVETVNLLAAVFDCNAIAEGVETVDHWVALLQLSCEYGQGYGIARPMPAEAVPAWLSHWKEAAIWQPLQAVVVPGTDSALVVARVNHQRWLDELIAWISDGDTALLASLEAGMDANQLAARFALESKKCVFGKWYRGLGRRRYRKHAQFVAVGSLHDEVHRMAQQLVALVRSGERDEAKAGLAQLKDAGEALVNVLNELN